MTRKQVTGSEGWNIKWLLGVLERWLQPIVFLALTAALGTVVSPFNVLALLGGLALACLSVGLYLGVNVSRPVAVHLKSSRGVALAIAGCAVTFMAIWPLIVIHGPLIIFVGDNPSPWESKLGPLGSGGLGRALFVTDPIRRLLVPVVSRMEGQRIRVVESRQSDGHTFLIIPMTGALKVPETGPVSTTGILHVLVPLRGTGVSLNILGAYPLEHSAAVASVSVDPIGGFLFSFDRPLARQIRGWDWIDAGTHVTLDDIRYVGMVDQALALVADGDLFAAIDDLECAGAVAKSHEEYARTLVLLGEIFNEYLSGNVGCLQALVMYNAAFPEVVAASGGSEPTTPLVTWMAGQLVEEYSAFDTTFGGRRRTLEPLLDDHHDNRRLGGTTYAGFVSDALYMMGTREFMDIADSLTKKSATPGDIEFFLLIGPWAVLGAEPANLFANGHKDAAWASADRRAGAVRRVARLSGGTEGKAAEACLDLAEAIIALGRAEALPESLRTRAGARLVKFMVHQARAAGLSRTAAEYNELEVFTEKRLTGAAADSAIVKIYDRDVAPAAATAAWWSADYTDFALASVSRVVFTAVARDTSWLDDTMMARLVRPDLLATDGRGRSFVPGVVAIARLLEAKPSLLHRRFKAIADDALGVGYENLVNVRRFANDDSSALRDFGGPPGKIAADFRILRP
jgi:hypothetical protein